MTPIVASPVTPFVLLVIIILQVAFGSQHSLPATILLIATGRTVVSLALPVAFSQDIQRLPDNLDWQPSKEDYVIAGVVGVFVGGIGPAASLYYLYKRRVHVGVP